MLTAFVAGATGYTGREVVTFLREEKIPVVAHVRPDSQRLDEWRRHFIHQGATVDSTPWQEKAMTETLAHLKPDIIFSLLGTTRSRGESYDSVDYGLTALLIRSTIKAGLKSRFVYLSATGVGPKARGAYLEARWKTEQELIKSGLPYTIARPSFITGSDRDDRRPLERWGALATDTLLAIANILGAHQLRHRYHSTTNTILARALIHHAQNPDSSNSKGQIIESENLR